MAQAVSRVAVGGCSRLRRLEIENERLKKLVAERDLEIEVMKEVAAKKPVSVPVRRKQVAYRRERGLSARRACRLFSVARSPLGYHSRRAVNDARVVEHMTALSSRYPRYGYRRIQIFLGRDGHRMSPGRALSAVAGGEASDAAQAGARTGGAVSAAATGFAGGEPGLELKWTPKMGPGA